MGCGFEALLLVFGVQLFLFRETLLQLGYGFRVSKLFEPFHFPKPHINLQTPRKLKLSHI